MAKLLYITANPKGSGLSKGLQIGEAFIERFAEEKQNIEITRHNLFHFDIPEMDADLVSARGKIGGYGMTLEQLEPVEREKIIKMHQLADEFVKHDYFVFVSPVWNFGSPAVLKAYLDNLFVHGKTFAFTPAGAKGLLTGKKAIHIQTRGGIYSSGPLKELESGDRYLKIALTFLGIEMLDTVFAEGLDHFPKKVPEIVAAAKEQAREAACKMAHMTARSNL
ncbi:FMN-dependent NADH-azoreductase [Mesobacillus zeae]|uniref:FMN dependent NADH:quinone oxidoreductase n=1 Tax=Mesobacillus zeae TaxID=1917180 RepID=A0A398BDS2_9BACI|nr:NAD(P)H-dependent oxidoreductase [Mesobacillus zeae]RID88335.1 NAD(P)H dehydrogenase [Mesobacillus zeae]